MDYITTKEVAKNSIITDGMVVYYYSNRRIKEAKKMVNPWLLPIDTKNPVDVQCRLNKIASGENK